MATAPVAEIREVTPRPPKPQREPREVREPREPREPRAQREPREASEGRRERTPRAPREDRKETVAATEENVIKTVVPASINVEHEQVDLINPVEAVQESVLDGDDQPRRRRRRGGRNRNRRDRDSTESAESENAESGDASHDESAVHAAHDTATDVVAEVMPQEQAARAASVQSVTAELVTGQPGSAMSHVPMPVRAEQEAPEPVVAVSTPEPVVAVSAPESVVTVSTPEPVVAVSAPEPVVAVSAPEPEAPVADIAAPVVATPVATASQPVMTESVAPAARQVSVNLEEVIKAAGLTMAVTNPEKLRAVQEVTAEVALAPRVPRERKPVSSSTDAPLVQIETQR